MWGSDWPVLVHVGDSYADWVDDARALAGLASAEAEAELFEGAARRFYGLVVDD
jgi:L-fuconolactonase